MQARRNEKNSGGGLQITKYCGPQWLADEKKIPFQIIWRQEKRNICRKQVIWISMTNKSLLKKIFGVSSQSRKIFKVCGGLKS